MIFRNLKANVIETVENQEIAQMMLERPDTYELVKEEKKEAKPSKK